MLRAARAGYGAFLKAWPVTDASLPEVSHAREVLRRPNVGLGLVGLGSSEGLSEAVRRQGETPENRWPFQ